MKTANLDNGNSVLAEQDAPSLAICPRCGGIVILRKRTIMGKRVTYFWRHQDNRNMKCKRRTRVW